MSNLTLYHGSPEIVQQPSLTEGKAYSDFGAGFYCTVHKDRAKEWACCEGADGYSGEYELTTDGLNILRFGDDNYSLLSWLFVVTGNRKFAVSSHVMQSALEWLGQNFYTDTSGYDVIIGPRCDDSYFAVAMSFLKGEISYRTFCACMNFERKESEQIALVSERAFSQLRFVSYEPGDFSLFSPKRMVRDARLRAHLKRLCERDEFGALYMRDIIREGVTNYDSRLR